MGDVKGHLWPQGLGFLQVLIHSISSYCFRKQLKYPGNPTLLGPGHPVMVCESQVTQSQLGACLPGSAGWRLTGKLETGHRGGIYTMDIGRCYKAGLMIRELVVKYLPACQCPPASGIQKEHDSPLSQPHALNF